MLLLLAFVEEMGHEYAPLLDGAAAREVGEDIDKPDPTAILAAVEGIRHSSWTREAGFVEDESEDEDENGGKDWID